MTNILKPDTPDTTPSSPRQQGALSALLSSAGSKLRKFMNTAPKASEAAAKAADVIPAWSMTMNGLVNGKTPIEVTITRIQNDRELRITCSDGFVSKEILFPTSEEALRIQERLSQLSNEEKSALAGNLGFTDIDDGRINHPNGAGIHMQDSIVKACAAKNAE